MAWVNRYQKTIPRIKTSTIAPEWDDYSKGMNSFVSNDILPDKFWRLAQDARITTLGEYETRKGFEFHSDAAGTTEDQTITSTTGAADKSFNESTRLAQIFTAGSTGRLDKVEVNLKNAASATGTIIVEIWSDVSTAPGVLLARSSIDSSDLTSSYAYHIARFAEAPDLTATASYWIVVYTQDAASGSYSWSSTTSATTAKTSTDSGVTWSSTSYALNFKQNYATTAGVKGLHRAYKSDGTAVTIFWHGTVMYSVNEVTGALTSIKTGLSASATHYRAIVINDILYYVNGFDGLRKWDFTTESQVNATNYTHIAEHKGLLFLVRKTDPNRVDYSNFADYETFTSTDFVYVPSPKTGDPVSAMISLNGYLMLFTRNNKYILSGSDNATFALDQAPDQKGTYTQETVTIDKNLAYYLGNDGVYRTNGSEAQLISKNIYNDVLNMSDRETAVMIVVKGRLYLWHESIGSAYNDQCWVWNLNYGEDTVESFDTDAHVTRAFNAYNDDNELLVGSSKLGQVYWQGRDSNDHTNLGGDINFLLQSHYYTFGAPAVEKQIRYWKPRFGAQSGDYTISCEYAYDLRDNWALVSGGAVDVQGSGYEWGDAGTVWGAFTWGSTAELQANLYIPSQYRRVAVRYKHYATRQPNTFLGHNFVVQVKRLR